MTASIQSTLPETATAASPARAKVLTSVQALEIDRVSGQEWDAVIADFDGVCQEQLYTFACNRWPDTETEPLLFRKDGEVVGGVLILIQSLPFKLGAIAVSKWGPIFKDNCRSDFESIYAGAIEALIAEYDSKRKIMLSVQPRAVPNPENVEFLLLKERGFATGSQWLFPDRYIVNLRLDDEGIRKSFAQKWRYHLNKSLKANLTFEHAGPERFEDFNKLYQVMADRKRFADHSAYDDTISSLMAMENPKLRPELYFVWHEDEIVAGAIIFKAGDTAVYLYGATNAKALTLRAGYFLHWHIIRWLRDNTVAKWYDLGGTDGFQGLHQFKKGMVGGAGAVEAVPPMMTFSSYLLPSLAGRGAFLARDVLERVRRFIEQSRPNAAQPDQDR